ncbi:MAG: hypothetical protein KC729_14700, partial [Candidatus Eisenbacteria bacterium]|nr:hypothetical protein [Candidatus Eisenbacteria bacterium]
YRDIGFGEGDTVYRSWRSGVDGADLSRYPRPERVIRIDLGAGLSAVVPTTVYADDRHRTLPIRETATTGDDDVSDSTGEGPAPLMKTTIPIDGKPEGFRMSGNDRTTRLAAVVLCWAVLREFYPDFDLGSCRSWDDSLRETLREAALDPDREAFLWTIRRMLACLGDGHADVHPFFPEAPGRLPLSWRWIENRLVITEVADPDAVTGRSSVDADGSPGIADGSSPLAGGPALARGDVVESIDGIPARARIDSLGAFISSPTDRWRIHRATERLLTGPIGVMRRLRVVRGTGERLDVALPLSPTARVENALASTRREPIRMVGDGIFYVDLTRLNDEQVERFVMENTAAHGIVFDLRGGPDRIRPMTLGHWIDRPVHSPEWRVPLVHEPAPASWIHDLDPRDREIKSTRWALDPETPQLDCPIAFLMDERSISRAETYLAIAGTMGAPLVGSPSAGTLGNANRATLPGGFRITWTGRYVFAGERDDGTNPRLSGTGLRPTVPVTATIAGIRAGRDEPLERAVALVSGS